MINQAARIEPAEALPVTEKSSFIYGEDSIEYVVVRTNGVNPGYKASTQPSKIRIKVHPDQRVIVSAPQGTSQMQIHAAVIKRARWIWKNKQDFATQKDFVLNKQYISGDTQLYLGRRYVLKVHTDESQTAAVKLSRGMLNVYLGKPNPKNSAQQASQVKLLTEDWYKYRAKVIFQQRLNEMLPKASWVKESPIFRVMTMKKQWGSCSAKGTLMLNPHLVKAPKECIDYVILHELCHIAEHNHSDKFWRLLTQVMPNWKEVKANLDGMAELYLNE